uniref:transmembrane O-methyltransferase homolog n=1 Tax=Scatophagus argus TaxID=75038 RepID=UPI001ED85E1F|nr:transmembrane O-methyltransferase homolog [Scatophagus argus]
MQQYSNVGGGAPQASTGRECVCVCSLVNRLYCSHSSPLYLLATTSWIPTTLPYDLCIQEKIVACSSSAGCFQPAAQLLLLDFPSVFDRRHSQPGRTAGQFGIEMWLMVVCAPLLPAIAMVSGRYHVKAAALCRRALAWALRLLRGRVCVRSTHAFVFSRCTHGKADSVLETFDLYADTHPSFCISPQIAEALDDVVRRVQPSLVLELGMHCGYSSVRLLRLLPPAGRLITVEQDPLTADLGEEIILVAGFKHSHFQVLTCSSAEAILTLRPFLELSKGTNEGLSLVLMDHDPQQYFPDLLALESEELLSPSGCSVLLIYRNQRAEDLRDILDHVRSRPDCYCIKSELQFMMEIFYQKA